MKLKKVKVRYNGVTESTIIVCIRPFLTFTFCETSFHFHFSTGGRPAASLLIFNATWDAADECPGGNYPRYELFCNSIVRFFTLLSITITSSSLLLSFLFCPKYELFRNSIVNFSPSHVLLS